jgi:hypothetical protein
MSFQSFNSETAVICPASCPTRSGSVRYVPQAARSVAPWTGGGTERTHWLELLPERTSRPSDTRPHPAGRGGGPELPRGGSASGTAYRRPQARRGLSFPSGRPGCGDTPPWRWPAPPLGPGATEAHSGRTPAHPRSPAGWYGHWVLDDAAEGLASDPGWVCPRAARTPSGRRSHRLA